MQDELIEQVKALVAVAKENHLKTFSVQMGDFSLHLESEDLVKPTASLPNQPVQPHETAIDENIITIKSPLVGTFYRSPSPNAPSFVEVGDIIEPRQVMCIIEAMKVMNEISSDIKGKVIEIVPENGQIVDFGHPLFILEPILETEDSSL
ncbi:acetyl-CoA carboxylase, biotin carboxyl carrier protein [bacterium]|nr:acetyl-CoA carboxylase, biotin carboxyl carrier protein [bacterium]